MQKMAYILLTGIFFISFTGANSQTLSSSNPPAKINIYKRMTPTSHVQDEKQATQELLKQYGIHIQSIHSGYDGLAYPLPKESNMGKTFFNPMHSGEILIITIQADDWPKLADANLNFYLCSDLQKEGGNCHIFHYSHLYRHLKDKPYVSVYKYSNQIQCQPQAGHDIQKVEQALTEKNIVVYQRFEGFSGETFPLQCGKKTNHIFIYVIEKSKLGIAISLGFNECAWLKKNNYDCHRFKK